MEGHVLAALIKKTAERDGAGPNYELLAGDVRCPALSLLISGGHTQIVLVEKMGSYRIVGETRDDAIGECFDKVARTLGLAYPGGPKISAYAAEARTAGIASPEPLPRPMIDTKDMDFSFSGLKTAVLYLTKRLTAEGKKIDDATLKGICREVEDAITDVIRAKMRKAIEAYAVETLVIGGGVIANAHIRAALEKLANECSLDIRLPQTDHATDNGLMIAIAGYVNREKAVSADTPLKAIGTLPLGPKG
jgi:N6-L-threonylcarbamoyladenine synthase